MDETHVVLISEEDGGFSLYGMGAGTFWIVPAKYDTVDDISRFFRYPKDEATYQASTLKRGRACALADLDLAKLKAATEKAEAAKKARIAADIANAPQRPRSFTPDRNNFGKRVAAARMWADAESLFDLPPRGKQGRRNHG